MIDATTHGSLPEHDFGAAWLSHARGEGKRKGLPVPPPAGVSKDKEARLATALRLAKAGATPIEIAKATGVRRETVCRDLRSLRKEGRL